MDYLTAILSRLAQRHIETPLRMHEGQLRVMARGPTFRSLLDEAFNQIRQNAGGNVAVVVQLLAELQIIAGLIHDEERRHALRCHTDLLIETVERSVSSPHDSAAIQSVSQRAMPTSWQVWGKP